MTKGRGHATPGGRRKGRRVGGRRHKQKEKEREAGAGKEKRRGGARLRGTQPRATQHKQPRTGRTRRRAVMERRASRREGAVPGQREERKRREAEGWGKPSAKAGGEGADSEEARQERKGQTQKKEGEDNR